MKIKRPAHFRPVALVALGVFLGRGAQADTVLDFDSFPPDGGVNVNVQQTFGDYAGASSDGVTVVGFGTPNIGLSWQSAGGAWQYYIDSVWAAVQLDNSAPGNTHAVLFAPNSAAARVVVKSFNFHPYYDSSERFTYLVSVAAGTNVISGPTRITFLSDAMKNHPVSLNCTGALGQTLKLQLDRVASTLGSGEVEGDPYDIAVDDIAFAQLPETVLPTGPEVVSVTPADGQTGVPAVYYPYLAGITNGGSALVTDSIVLKLDGQAVAPPATISSANGLTNVSYPGTALLASGAHVYTLTYADNLGSNFTNEVDFTVSYTTLPTAYASPPGSGTARGFTYRTVAAPQDLTGTLPSTIARAQAQLDGTLIDPGTGSPYPNLATPGPNPDGSFNIDTVLNFDDDGTGAGNFPEDQPFPGLDAGPYNWFSTEAWLYLDLPPGYYRFGVNSDDGFEVSAAPPEGVAGPHLVLGSFDNGRGADDTLFDVLVQTAGLYSFQAIYFESTGSASCEFFSADPTTGQKTLINDALVSKAVKSYRALKQRITRIVRNDPDVAIDWAYGVPPFQVQFKRNITDAWGDLGAPTTQRTATVPIQPGAGFIQVVGQ
jgi:hypothetical protein